MNTRLYTTLLIDQKMYDAIRNAMMQCGYGDRVHVDYGGEFLDMAGLALQVRHGSCPFCMSSLITCRMCGTSWCKNHGGPNPRITKDTCHKCGNKGIEYV